MKIHFQIEYTDKEGNNVESLASLDLNTSEDKQIAHKLLDEFIFHHESDGAQIRFGGECKCYSN